MMETGLPILFPTVTWVPRACLSHDPPNPQRSLSPSEALSSGFLFAPQNRYFLGPGTQILHPRQELTVTPLSAPD